MFFSDHPNKSLIQTAVEMGIDNTKTSRNLNQEEIKAEYEKVKKALQKGGESEEITTLYTKFVTLYEANLKTSTQATAVLKDELKWKHIGDLREAVKNGGKGLSLTDIEGLNQFALAEHGRQDRSDSQRDDTTVALLGEWFRMYETLKQKSIESMKVSYKDALRAAFLTATSTPFTFRYSEGNNIYELSVTLKDNKIVVGSKEHALVGERIKVGSISMDKDKLYIPFTMDGKASTYSEPIKKQEFLDKYLQDILDGKDIRIQGNLVRVSRTGELSPRVLVEGPAVPRTQAEIQRETLSLDEAIKKGFMSLVSGKKSEPLTVLQDGKKYRFPLEVDQNSFTLGGKKFDFTFPSDIRRGSFEFSNDAIIFSGISRGESRVKELFEISKSDVAKKLSGATNEVVFGSEETGKIVARGTGEYLPSSALINSPNPPANAPSATSPVGREGVKYGLKELEGYAKEKLALYGKDIGALQSALKAKKFYTGEITGVYDMATLDAVLAFQKTIKNSEFGADGLVGKETISSLFGISTGPNNPAPVPPVSPAPGAPGAPPVAPLPAPVPGTRPGSGGVPGAPPASPGRPAGGPGSQEVISEEVLLKKLREKAEAFRGVYKAVSEKTGMIFDTPAEIEQYKKAINEALLPLQKVLIEFEGKKISDQTKEEYNGIVLEVARYFSDGYSGIKNRHYRNYDLSVDLALSVIKDDLVRLKITPPRKPGTEEVLRALATHNPKLQQKIQEDLRAGFQLGQILANPRVRSEFDAVYNTVYADYERGLQAVITKLRDKNTTFTNPSGYKALDMLIFTMGTTDMLDLKARNRDIFWQSIGMIGSTAAGVVAFAATPATGGAGAILGGAILGGVVSTAGMIATKGRAGIDWETGIELGINTVTFGVGGVVAKGANILMKNGNAIAKLSGYTLDAAGGIGLGVGADYARAFEQGTNISLPETIRNNLAWAFLPMLLGMKGALRDRAVVLDKNMQRARAQAVTGDIEGVNQTIKAIEKDAADLAHDVKAVVPTAPVPKNAPASAAPATPAPKAAPAAKPAPKPTETPVSYDVGNGYVLQARPDNKFIVLKDGNPQGTIPKSLAEIEGELATAHNTIIPEGVKAQIAARSAVPPAPTVEPPAPAQAPKPAPEPAPEPAKSPPVAAPARATPDDHAAPAPAPKRKPPEAHSAVHLSEAQAHAVADEAAKTVNQQLAKFTDHKAIKVAWEFATREVQPGGIIKTSAAAIANIPRIPLINARKIMEIWFTKSEKGFQPVKGDWGDQLGNSLSTAVTASSKPFAGFPQSVLTLITMGTVGYITYEEVKRSNPNSPYDWTVGAAWKFLVNMNFTFPKEAVTWFLTKEKVETAGAQVPPPAPRAVPAPTPPPLPSPPSEQRAGELPPSEVQPGEVRTDPISDTTTPQ